MFLTLTLPDENSHDILGIGCPLAEHGRRTAAPAETDVFCGRHTQVGGSERRNYFIYYPIHLIEQKILTIKLFQNENK